ncbi:ribose-phosphate diphosphokinase [Hyphococcus sp. DH-69]|uniref:ribose-phosphate diphosphokinase n=1 Tax=Hyphococcus formosus TaxID=3143534 RepID=UPI00398AEA5F
MIAAMPGERSPASTLAEQLNLPLCEISVHTFPDGESLVRVPQSASTVIVYSSLNQPNDKLINLSLAASALRDIGAQRVILVAPYLCYMRQDKAFNEGEAVSQRVIGEMLASWFDRIITVEPHLHRTQCLDEVFSDTDITVLSAAPLLAEIATRTQQKQGNSIIVGPDKEASRWAEAVATASNLPFIILDKTRTGDTSVSISSAETGAVRHKDIILIDDVVSTGTTLICAAQYLKDCNAKSIKAVVVHALFGEAEYTQMRNAGIKAVHSTDSVRHPTNSIKIAPLLAKTLLQELNS